MYLMKHLNELYLIPNYWMQNKLKEGYTLVTPVEIKLPELNCQRVSDGHKVGDYIKTQAIILHKHKQKIVRCKKIIKKLVDLQCSN